MDADTMSEVKVARLEEQVKALQEGMEAMKTVHQEMNDKLDSLLTLKNKGAGAFWLATIIFGTSLMGVFSYIVDLIKH